MKIRKWALLTSFLVPFFSIFIDTIEVISNNNHALGLPFNFLYYRGMGFPDSRFQLFVSDYFIQTEYRVINFILNMLIVYWISILVYKLTLKIKEKVRN